MTSRREFLGAASLASTLAAVGHAAQLQTLGVQLYTVRSLLPQKAPEVMKALRDIGYVNAEPSYAGLDAIWPAIEASGLKPLSIHLDAASITRGTPDDLSRILDGLKARGFQYAVFPYLADPERGGADVIKALSAKFNIAGERCRAAGLKFCYHNHAFEFAKAGDGTLFDVMLQNTDPKLVSFEVDLFWVSVAGLDPAEFLGKLKGRVAMVHVKDKAEGTPVMTRESVPRTAFKEVGSGVMDWPKILRAAAAAGVSQYIVEQDQTPGDPVESLRQSYGYLSKLTF
jgi:sugar phosphate isomerase/epimerase